MFDLVVVGGGMSGTAVASAALRKGIDACVLEAGPDLGHQHIAASNKTAHLAISTRDPCFEPFIRGPQAGIYKGESGYRTRVGGRSLYWRGIALRLETETLEMWPVHISKFLLGSVNSTGSYESVERRLQNWMGGRSLSVARTAVETQMCAEFKEIGFDAMPTPRAVRMLDDDLWEAYSPLDSTERTAIVPNFRVSSIRSTRNGFVVDSSELGNHAIDARTVVLAAGTFQNITLLDGIRQGLNTERVSHQNYEVTDHIASGMVRFEPCRLTSSHDSSILLGYQDSVSSHIFVEQQPISDGILHDCWAMAEQPPQASTHVEVSPMQTKLTLDRDALSIIDALAIRQRRFLDDLLGVMNTPLTERQSVKPFELAVDNARNSPGKWFPYFAGLGELDHEGGGLSMGGKLIDDNCQVRDVPGLYVVGPCLFPRLGSANPTLTNLALADYTVTSIGNTL